MTIHAPARISLVTTTAAAIIYGIHHVFRLGLPVLAPALVVALLPWLLMRWYRTSARDLALWAYGAFVGLMFIWFGFVDGFLDHVLKALGLENSTLLPGGEAEIVHTELSLWSTEAGAAFYEGTGVLEAILGFISLGTTVALMWRTRRTIAVSSANVRAE